MDYQDLIHARQLLDKLATSTQNVSDLMVTDTFAKDVDDLIGLSISEFLRQEARRDHELLHPIGRLFTADGRPHHPDHFAPTPRRAPERPAYGDTCPGGGADRDGGWISRTGDWHVPPQSS